MRQSDIPEQSPYRTMRPTSGHARDDTDTIRPFHTLSSQSPCEAPSGVTTYLAYVRPAPDTTFTGKGKSLGRFGISKSPSAKSGFIGRSALPSLSLGHET